MRRRAAFTIIRLWISSRLNSNAAVGIIHVLKEEWDAKAILCGHCQNELSINEYLNSGNVCQVCKANFNPGCAEHYDLYFEKQ